MRHPTNRFLVSTILGTFLFALACMVHAQSMDEGETEQNEGALRASRAQYELMRLMDPATGMVPENIRAKELKFASRQWYTSLTKIESVQGQIVNWVSRGPSNVGGRTRALGIDVANEAIVLAGGTSGGMWRSADSGVSWIRTTLLEELPSTSCLAQDRRAGKTKTWYYGTGELGGNNAANPFRIDDAGFKWGEYYGNGIYKSTDNGLTWNVLPSTTTDTLVSLVQPFNFVNKIALDPSRSAEDVVYAAVAGGIERSSDGGASWTMVLGTFPPGSIFTDVAVTSTGVVYALLGSGRDSWELPNPTSAGLYRSTDGIHWVRISSEGWEGFSYVSLAISASNENVIYMSSNDKGNQATLWKYTYLSGDGSGSGGKSEDRSQNLRQSGISVSVFASVKPDDENTIFVGGVPLCRSTDGFATVNMITGVTPPHVDQMVMAYFPSNPASMLVGCDGGVFSTADNLASQLSWKNLNNNYLTTQFYTVAIDHATPGNSTIVGGMQDNDTRITNTADATLPWKVIGLYDGATCQIADSRKAYYVSFQYGTSSRKLLNEQGYIVNECRIDPIGSSAYPFINPFTLDPNNTDRMYFGGGTFLWRHDSLPAVPCSDARSVGWNKLSNTTITEIDTIVKQAFVSTIAVSRSPANRVYYGTTDGQLFRLDGANASDLMPTDIWKGKGFPASSYVSAIGVDRWNADNVLVAFANYSVQSLFYTSDGGMSWTAIGGNLEEYSDGKGNGPSCRTVAILHSGTGIVYLVGTSTGLYSTSTLNGMSTVWSLEGATSMGNSIVNMIDTRESDGLVAVATFGHGIFSGNFEPAVGVKPESAVIALGIELSPNPTNGIITVHDAPENLTDISVMNVLGENVLELASPHAPNLTLDLSNLPAGMYYARFAAANSVVMRTIIRQ